VAEIADLLVSSNALTVKYGRRAVAKPSTLFDEDDTDNPAGVIEWVSDVDFLAGKCSDQNEWVYERYYWPTPTVYCSSAF